MRQPFVILALFLTLPMLAEAGFKQDFEAECLARCFSQVEACIARHRTHYRHCARRVVRRCRLWAPGASWGREPAAHS